MVSDITIRVLSYIHGMCMGLIIAINIINLISSLQVCSKNYISDTIYESCILNLVVTIGMFIILLFGKACHNVYDNNASNICNYCSYALSFSGYVLGVIKNITYLIILNDVKDDILINCFGSPKVRINIIYGVLFVSTFYYAIMMAIVLILLVIIFRSRTITYMDSSIDIN